MALPDLPDIFGNYTLRGFQEILAPEAISWYPAAPGWRVLLLLGLVWLSCKLVQKARYWWRNRYRRFAIEALRETLAGSSSPEQKLGSIASLLKATALQAYDRREVAALSGQDWINWLNDLTPTPLFGEEQLQLLTIESYRETPQLGDMQLRILADAVEGWIGAHREPAHD